MSAVIAGPMKYWTTPLSLALTETCLHTHGRPESQMGKPLKGAELHASESSLLVYASERGHTCSESRPSWALASGGSMWLTSSALFLASWTGKVRRTQTF